MKLIFSLKTDLMHLNIKEASKVVILAKPELMLEFELLKFRASEMKSSLFESLRLVSFDLF